jgi:CRP-like cAMP-binding protein
MPSPTPHFLERIFPASTFSKEDRTLILPAFKRVKFPKHQFALSVGSAVDVYWYVESGMLRSYALNPQGKDITTNFYEAGSLMIDWVAFFTRSTAHEYIEALTDCVCWQLDYSTFHQLSDGVVAFRRACRSQMVQSYFALKRRSVSLVTEEATVRYSRFVAEQPELAQTVPLKHLASYLGITDSTLSRVRKGLTKHVP